MFRVGERGGCCRRASPLRRRLRRPRLCTSANLSNNNVSLFAIGAGGKLSVLALRPSPQVLGRTALPWPPTATAPTSPTSVRTPCRSSASRLRAAAFAQDPGSHSHRREPYRVAVNPDGKSAYVTSSADDTVSQYDIDPQTGALSPKAPATVAAGAFPWGIAMSPDGGSAYVVNFHGDTISAVQRRFTDGCVVSEVPGSRSYRSVHVRHRRDARWQKRVRRKQR